MGLGEVGGAVREDWDNMLVDILESKGPRNESPDVQGQEKMDIPAQGESLPFLCFSCYLCSQGVG